MVFDCASLSEAGNLCVRRYLAALFSRAAISAPMIKDKNPRCGTRWGIGGAQYELSPTVQGSLLQGSLESGGFLGILQFFALGWGDQVPARVSQLLRQVS